MRQSIADWERAFSREISLDRRRRESLQRAAQRRTLKREDAKPDSDLPPAVLSYGFWKSRFRGDPRVADGGTIDLQRRRFAIVGVMPREFNGAWTRRPTCEFPGGPFRC